MEQQHQRENLQPPLEQQQQQQQRDIRPRPLEQHQRESRPRPLEQQDTQDRSRRRPPPSLSLEPPSVASVRSSTRSLQQQRPVTHQSRSTIPQQQQQQQRRDMDPRLMEQTPPQPPPPAARKTSNSRPPPTNLTIPPPPPPPTPEQPERQQETISTPIASKPTTLTATTPSTKPRPRYFSQANVEAIRDAVDLVEVVESYQLPQFHRRGSGAIALCPFHDDHNPSLSIDGTRGLYKCFACGAAGNVFSFVREMHALQQNHHSMYATDVAVGEMSFGQAVQFVYEEFVTAEVDLSLSPISNTTGRWKTTTSSISPELWQRQQHERDMIHQANAAAAAFYIDSLLNMSSGPARRYLLLHRGLTPAVVKRFAIGYAPNAYPFQREEASKRSWGEGSLVQHLHSLNFTAQQMVDAGLAIVMRRQRPFPNQHSRTPSSPHQSAVHNTSLGSNQTGENDHLSEKEDILTIDRIMDRFRGRIMVPIVDSTGNFILGFGGRLVPPWAAIVTSSTDSNNNNNNMSDVVTASSSSFQAPKYLNSPETLVFHKQQLLFGQHFIRSMDQARRKDGTNSPSVLQDRYTNKSSTLDAPLVIVEGYLDAISLASAGMERVVATMGTSISLTQLEQAAESVLSTQKKEYGFSRDTHVIVLCLDQDEAGQAATERLCRDGMLSQVMAKYSPATAFPLDDSSSSSTPFHGRIEFRVAQMDRNFSDPAALVEHLQQECAPQEEKEKQKKAKRKKKGQPLDPLEEKQNAERRKAFVEESVRAQLLDSAIPWTEWYVQRMLTVFASTLKGMESKQALTSNTSISKNTSQTSKQTNKPQQRREAVSRIFYQVAALLSDQQEPKERSHLASFAADALVAILAPNTTETTTANTSSLSSSQSNATTDETMSLLASLSSPTAMLQEEVASDLLDLASRIEGTRSASSNHSKPEVTNRSIRNIKTGTMSLEAMLHRTQAAGKPDIPMRSAKVAQSENKMIVSPTGRRVPRVARDTNTLPLVKRIRPTTNQTKALAGRKPKGRKQQKPPDPSLTPHYSGLKFANQYDREWVESTIPEKQRKRRGRGQSDNLDLMLIPKTVASAVSWRNRHNNLPQNRWGKSNNYNRFRPVFFNSNEYHGKKFLTDEAKAVGYTGDITIKEDPAKIFEKGVGILAERDTDSVAWVVEDALLRELILYPPARAFVLKWCLGKQAVGTVSNVEDGFQDFQWSSKEKKWLFHVLVLEDNRQLDSAGARKPAAVRRLLSTRNDAPPGAFASSSWDADGLGDPSFPPTSFSDDDAPGLLDNLFAELSTMEEELSSSSSSPTHMEYNLRGLLGEMSWVSARRESEFIEQQLLNLSKKMDSGVSEEDHNDSLSDKADLLSLFKENVNKLNEVTQRLRSVDEMRHRTSALALDANNALKVEGRISTSQRAKMLSEIEAFVCEMSHHNYGEHDGSTSRFAYANEEPYEITFQRIHETWGEWCDDSFVWDRPEKSTAGASWQQRQGRPKNTGSGQARPRPQLVDDEPGDPDEPSLEEELDRMDRDWGDWLD